MKKKVAVEKEVWFEGKMYNKDVHVTPSKVEKANWDY